MKGAPYILLVVLLVATVLVLRLGQCNTNSNVNSTGKRAGSTAASNNSNASNAGTETNRNRGFDRRTTFLEYTKHARCRMDCREITETEVQDIMKNGAINYRKSNVKASPCPTYALEGYTHDRQHVRIVFAQCDEKTKVVTCIDLEKDWVCHCPGDDDKYKNQ